MRLAPGTLYEALNRLEGLGLIEACRARIGAVRTG